MGASLLTGKLFGSDPNKYNNPIAGDTASGRYKEAVADNFSSNTGAQGYTPTPNPYASGSPSWATGWFGMPWWGTDATNGSLLNQSDVQVTGRPQQSYYQQQQLDVSGILDALKAQEPARTKRSLFLSDYRD